MVWKCQIFSKHRPSGPMLSISRNVRPSVRVCVCPCVCSLLRYRLTVFLPPLPKVGCPIFLEIRNPWGKVMERSGLIYGSFFLWVRDVLHLYFAHTSKFLASKTILIWPGCVGAIVFHGKPESKWRRKETLWNISTFSLRELGTLLWHQL